MNLLNQNNIFMKLKSKSQKSKNISDFTSTFLKYLHGDDTPASENLELAFKKVNEKFNETIKDLDKKFFISFYYNNKGNPNKHYYELMSFWKIFKKFYTYEHDRYILIQYCLILEDLKHFEYVN